MVFRAAAILVVLLCVGGPAAPAQTQDVLQILAPLETFLESDYQTIRRVKEIPSRVMPAVWMTTGGRSGGFADPGKDFNPTDARDSRPSRRLIFAGQGKDTFFIAFEQGGIALHNRFLLFIVDDTGALLVWEGTFGDSVGTVEEIKALVRSGGVTQVRRE